MLYCMKIERYPFNAYVICAAGTSLVARDYMQWVSWTVLLGVIVCIERVIFKKKQIKKLEQFIWKTGEVVSDIDRSHVVVEQM